MFNFWDFLGLKDLFGLFGLFGPMYYILQIHITILNLACLIFYFDFFSINFSLVILKVSSFKWFSKIIAGFRWFQVGLSFIKCLYKDIHFAMDDTGSGTRVAEHFRLESTYKFSRLTNNFMGSVPLLVPSCQEDRLK